MTIYKTYKTEINPTEQQKSLINESIGTCRYLKNLYLEMEDIYYKRTGKFLTANVFDKWYRKKYIPLFRKEWIKNTSSKARKEAIRDTEKAFKRWFKGVSGKPTFRKRGINDPSVYFVRNGKDNIINCERHRIKIPTLGWVKLKEKGYLPNKQAIISGRIKKEAGRYYVSVRVKIKEKHLEKEQMSDGVGIDLGIKYLAVVSDQPPYKNINYDESIKRIEKQLRHQQRSYSRKYESYKKRKKQANDDTDVSTKNLDKQRLKVQKLHQKLKHIRMNYENQVVHEILRDKPKYVVFEDLNIKGMLKNKYLSKSIRQQRWFSFKTKVIKKAQEYGGEIRIVNRFFPSSKTCSKCGVIDKTLTLKDREFNCLSCGYTIDRDENASINLKYAEHYNTI